MFLDVDGEGQAGLFGRQHIARLEDFFGNGRDLVAGDKIEFVFRGAFRKISRVALGKMHLQFARKQIRRKLADEQDDDAGVRELDADFFPREFKTVDVRRDQIDQQQHAQQIAARQNQRHLVAKEVGANHQPLLEIMRLRAVKPFIRLRNRADEHKHDGKSEQHHR